MREMKDSGVEWIGEIPANWITNKLLYSLKQPITDGPHETPNYISEGIPFISIDSLNNTKNVDLSVVNKFISNEQYENYNKKANLKKGDILFSKAATIGKTAIVNNEKFMVWSPLAILKSNPLIINNTFLYYLLNCNLLIDNIRLSGSFNSQANVGMREMERAIIPIPPIKEQQEIANCLDEKCSEINSITSDIQKQIETLQEYKKSVITEAVTKGLDPDVEMKDSGIEWIGEIPKKWKLSKMKYELNERMKYGASESGVSFSSELPRYIRITDITADNKLREDNKLSLTKEQSKGYILTTDTVLFARSGATVGKTFLYKMEYGEAAFAGYLISAVPNINKMKAKWLYFFTLSNAYSEWVKRIFTQSTIQNIGADKYSILPIIIPDLTTQQQIVEYLDNKCSDIDFAIEEKNKQLETLEQYKKSLIYEYATGKKEVPNYV